VGLLGEDQCKEQCKYGFAIEISLCISKIQITLMMETFPNAYYVGKLGKCVILMVSQKQVILSPKRKISFTKGLIKINHGR